MRTSKTDFLLTVILGIIFWIGLCLIKEINLEGYKESLPIIFQAATFAWLVRLLFVKYIWKFLPFLERFHSVPLLEGQWEGTFESTHIKEGDTEPTKGNVTVTIKQPSLYQIKIQQVSNESISRSFCEDIEVHENGDLLINYTYLNEPDAVLRDHSQISYGTSRFSLVSREPLTLKGNYWTDRKSTGTIRLYHS